MVSLQEQLLKAGLVDGKKAKQASKDKRKKDKVDRKSSAQPVDEVRVAAEAAKRKKVERDRELNAQRDATARHKAIHAQIKQMVAQNKQRRDGDIAYNFTHDKKIKKIYVSAAVQTHLMSGRLVIVGIEGSYELVPKVIADKIAERDASLLIRVENPVQAVEEDDPYAGYEIPDDLMW